MLKSYLIIVCIATAGVFASGPACAAEVGPLDEVREVPVFDGDFSVTVYPVQAMHERTEYTDESIAEDHDSLAGAAKRGDADAALQLFYALQRCRGAATTDEALESRVGAMLRTGMVGEPFFPEPTRVDDLARYIDLERGRLELCRGLTEEQIRHAHEWLMLAAELGDYGARASAMEESIEHYLISHGVTPDRAPGLQGAVGDARKFAAGAPAAFRAAAVQMLAARVEGSLQALRDLAIVYAAGALSPSNDYSAAANAYANLRAAAEVWQQAMPPGSYRFDADLRRFRKGLSADELDWAESEARAILREENCCRYW